MVQLGEHFRSDAYRTHSEAERQKWFIKSRVDRERQQRLDHKFHDEMSAVFSVAIAATEEAIRQFEAKLDGYDQATVEALMENQILLDEVRERLDAMLDRAYVMEDGRRVFKSVDGSFVVDEFGDTVAESELDAMLIPDSNPSAEDYLADLEQERELIADRKAILEFQEKVDSAREQIAEGEISQQELDELDAELLDVMPTSVSNRIPELENSSSALKDEFRPSTIEPQATPSNGPTVNHMIPG